MTITPGPWRAVQAFGGARSSEIDIRFGDDSFVGKAYKMDDALLLAAAPDLLRVVKRMMALHHEQLPSETADLYGGGCGCHLCEMGRVAIAKTKGISA